MLRTHACARNDVLSPRDELGAVYDQLSLWKLENLLDERDIDITYEIGRCWRNRFGTTLAAEIKQNRVRVWREADERTVSPQARYQSRDLA